MHFFRAACLPLLILATSATSVAACAAPQDETTSGEETTGEDDLTAARISEADDGKTVVVKEGQSFSIELGENASTGYEWKVTGTDRSLGYPYLSRHYKNLAGSEAVGSSGIRRFYWKTTSALGSLVGKHTIQLQYARSFETTPAKTVTITVDIQPAGGAQASVVEIASPGQFDVKEGQDFRVTLSGPSPSPLSGWKVVSTTRTLGYPEEKWVQGDGAVGVSGASTFLWHTAPAGPMSKVGEHRVALEIERGHGDPPSRFDFTVTITR